MRNIFKEGDAILQFISGGAGLVILLLFLFLLGDRWMSYISNYLSSKYPKCDILDWAVVSIMVSTCVGLMLSTTFLVAFLINQLRHLFTK